MVGKDAVDDLFDVVGRKGPPDPGREAGGSADGAPDGADEVEIVLRVHVQPGAGRTEVIGRHGDALKVKVAAPPEGGRANEAVAELLTTTLGLAQGAVSLLSGSASRSKRFRVDAIELDTVRRLLASAGSGPRPRASGRGGNAGTGRGVR